MKHCHRNGVIHADLKLENICYDSKKQENIKIADFSISRIFRIEEIIEQSKAKVNILSISGLLIRTGITHQRYHLQIRYLVVWNHHVYIALW
jgi:serine/threonine protein kinase